MTGAVPAERFHGSFLRGFGCGGAQRMGSAVRVRNRSLNLKAKLKSKMETKNRREIPGGGVVVANGAGNDGS